MGFRCPPARGLDPAKTIYKLCTEKSIEVPYRALGMGRRALGSSNTMCPKFWLSVRWGVCVGSSLLWSPVLNLKGGRGLSVPSVWALGALLWQNSDSGSSEDLHSLEPNFQSPKPLQLLKHKGRDSRHPSSPQSFPVSAEQVRLQSAQGIWGSPYGGGAWYRQRDSVLRTPVWL